MFDPKMTRAEMNEAYAVEGPIFEHCDECCIYIGPGVDPLNGGIGDLYICKVDRDRTPELLFRYGNEGHEYTCTELDMRTLCRSVGNDIGDWVHRLFKDGSFHADDSATAKLENPTKTQRVWGRKFRFEIRLVEVDEEAENDAWRRFENEQD